MRRLERYAPGKEVRLKLGKNRFETYKIETAYNNQTFDLKDGPGGKRKYGVKQRDLE